MTKFDIPSSNKVLSPAIYVHPTKHKSIWVKTVIKSENEIHHVCDSIVELFLDFTSHHELERIAPGYCYFYKAEVKISMLGVVDMGGYSTPVYSISINDKHGQPHHILRRIYKAAKCSKVQWDNLLQSEREARKVSQ